MITRRVNSLYYGLTLPWAALKLILSSKTLLFWSILPVGITLVLYFYLIRLLTDTANEWVVSLFQNWGWNPEGYAAFGIVLLLKLVVLLVGALTFAFTSSIVASPFNDMLAEKSEKYATPALSEVKDRALSHHVRIILIDLMKTVAAATASIFAIVFSWVPVLNVLSFILAFLLVCFQYTSYPQTRRGIGLKGGALFLWRHFYACAGFGAAISFLFAIPFLSSFALPVAVVGGTLLVARAPGAKSDQQNLLPLK